MLLAASFKLYRFMEARGSVGQSAGRSDCGPMCSSCSGFGWWRWKCDARYSSEMKPAPQTTQSAVGCGIYSVRPISKILVCLRVQYIHMLCVLRSPYHSLWGSLCMSPDVCLLLTRKHGLPEERRGIFPKKNGCAKPRSSTEFSTDPRLHRISHQSHNQALDKACLSAADGRS